jgi:DNA-binding transcriptional regulator LsrR (DeoR family)
MLPADEQILDEVAQVAIGDICGILVAGESHTAQHERRAELQHRWTGIRADQLLGLAGRARGSPTPGVIVIAFGARKVMTTLAAIREGYVNHLVIGEALTHGLDKYLTRALRQRQRTA